MSASSPLLDNRDRDRLDLDDGGPDFSDADYKQRRPRVLNRMPTHGSDESFITAPSPFPHQSTTVGDKTAAPLTPPASDEDSADEKRARRASKGLSLSRSMQNLKAKVGGSSYTNNASGTKDKKSRGRANTTVTSPKLAEAIPPVPPVPAMPASIAKPTLEAAPSSTPAPAASSGKTEKSSGLGSFFRKLAGKSPAPTSRTPLPGTSAPSAAPPTLAPALPTSATEPTRPPTNRSATSTTPAKKGLHLKLSTQSLRSPPPEPMLNSPRSGTAPSLPLVSSPSDLGTSLAAHMDESGVKRAGTLRRVPAPRVVTNPCDIPLPPSPILGGLQLPPVPTPEQPSIAVFTPEQTQRLPSVSPPKSKTEDFAPARAVPARAAQTVGAQVKESKNALLSLEGFDFADSEESHEDARDTIRPLPPLRIPSNNRAVSNPSPVTATEDDIVTPSSSLEDKNPIPRSVSHSNNLPSKAPVAPVVQPAQPASTAKLGRKESKWRKSVMNMSDPFNRRASQHPPQQQAAPAPRPQPTARPQPAAPRAPVVRESYVDKQRRLAANRQSCAPTQHSRASVAAEMQGIGNKEEQDAAETFFMA